MATNNFTNHKNGIFIIDGLEDLGYYQARTLIEDVLGNINHELLGKGYTVEVDYSDLSLTVYNKDRLVGVASYHDGYYGGGQIIFENDIDELTHLNYYWDTQTELNEIYTPNCKRVLKVISQFTTPIVRVAQFSNGEAFYERASI